MGLLSAVRACRSQSKKDFQMIHTTSLTQVEFLRKVFRLRENWASKFS